MRLITPKIGKQLVLKLASPLTKGRFIPTCAWISVDVRALYYLDIGHE
jgi:hypothetical protein